LPSLGGCSGILLSPGGGGDRDATDTCCTLCRVSRSTGLGAKRYTPYSAQAFNPAHPNLPRSAGGPAQLANEDYVKALAHIVYYWAYPAIDVFNRTGMWEIMKDGPGLMFGIAPGSPVNESGCISGYLPPAQRIVVTPNNDTFYGVAFLDLGRDRLSSRRRLMCLRGTIG
jgi:hypothetical protein